MRSASVRFGARCLTVTVHSLNKLLYLGLGGSGKTLSSLLDLRRSAELPSPLCDIDKGALGNGRDQNLADASRAGSTLRCTNFWSPARSSRDNEADAELPR